MIRKSLWNVAVKQSNFFSFCAKPSLTFQVDFFYASGHLNCAPQIWGKKRVLSIWIAECFCFDCPGGLMFNPVDWSETLHKKKPWQWGESFAMWWEPPCRAWAVKMHALSKDRFWTSLSACGTKKNLTGKQQAYLKALERGEKLRTSFCAPH